MKTSIIQVKKKIVRWVPNKEPPGGILFLLIGGWTHCFTIVFSYWFSISTIKNPIVPNQKNRKCQTNPVFFIWGRFSNKKKGLSEQFKSKLFFPYYNTFFWDIWMNQCMSVQADFALGQQLAAERLRRRQRCAGALLGGLPFWTGGKPWRERWRERFGYPYSVFGEPRSYSDFT